jgi:hypothetical protein
MSSSPFIPYAFSFFFLKLKKKMIYCNLEEPCIVILECVWYCGSCCGCGLKKVVLKKVLLVVVGLKK